MIAAFALVAITLWVGSARGETVYEAPPRLQLPIERIADPPSQYVAFCEANPGHCEMTGESVLAYTQQLMQLLRDVTRQVNSQYKLVPDWEALSIEECWSYPTAGYGDCEDFALEKRARLVKSGLPRAAMTMAIVHHKRLFFPHAILLVETSEGTYALDNLSDEVRLWHEIPYNFESRERVDGRWDRFDQSVWSHE